MSCIPVHNARAFPGKKLMIVSVFLVFFNNREKFQADT